MRPEISKPSSAPGMRNKTKSTTIKQVAQDAKDIYIQKEKGGTWVKQNDKIILLNEGIAKTIEGREAFIVIAKNHRVKPNWHMHPFATGWYPSIEDIGILNKKPHILITRYGIWVMHRYKHFDAPLKYPQIETKRLGDFIHSLHLYHRELYSSKTFGTNFNIALNAINDYSSFMDGYGFAMKFFPFILKDFTTKAEKYSLRFV
tara:strand:- start:9147 stop:9755 length:609 start_codon:yes stop_codon:yes gene_type:complete